MARMWKILITLGLLLPSGAFVAGVIAASTAPTPAPRETIVIHDSQPDSSTRSPQRQPRRAAAPSPLPSSTGGGVLDDHGNDNTPASDNGGVEAITPAPDDLGDAGDDRGRDSNVGGDAADPVDQGDDAGAQDPAVDNGGPGSGNGGPADVGNSGPGGGDDHADNSGPGGGDDHGDHSGPGGGGDDGDDADDGHGDDGHDDDNADDDGGDGEPQGD
jgi:hypothetical protein